MKPLTAEKAREMIARWEDQPQYLSIHGEACLQAMRIALAVLTAPDREAVWSQARDLVQRNCINFAIEGAAEGYEMAVTQFKEAANAK